MHRFVLVSIALIVAACSTARTLVLQPVDKNDHFNSAVLVEQFPAVDIPPGFARKIESVIRKGLYENGPFSDGMDLKIRYTFVSFDVGIPVARWFLAGIGNVGEGSVVVLVTYFNHLGQEIAQIQVEGLIKTGILGGSINRALEKAGDKIVEFTIENFSNLHSGI
jgi:hypothetical protein